MSIVNLILLSVLAGLCFSIWLLVMIGWVLRKFFRKSEFTQKICFKLDCFLNGSHPPVFHPPIIDFVLWSILEIVVLILRLIEWLTPAWCFCWWMMGQGLWLAGRVLFFVPYGFGCFFWCTLQGGKCAVEAIKDAVCTFTSGTTVITARDKTNTIGVACLKEEMKFTNHPTISDSNVTNDAVSVKHNKYNRRFKKTKKPNRM